MSDGHDSVSKSKHVHRRAVQHNLKLKNFVKVFGSQFICFYWCFQNINIFFYYFNNTWILQMLKIRKINLKKNCSIVAYQLYTFLFNISFLSQKYPINTNVMVPLRLSFNQDVFKSWALIMIYKSENALLLYNMIIYYRKMTKSSLYG